MFYVLKSPAQHEAGIVYGTVGGEDYPPIWETTNCRKCRAFITIKQINNLQMELFGEELQQIVWTDDAPLFSASLIQALTTSNLHGFAFRPVDIVAWWKLDSLVNSIYDALEREEAPDFYQLIPLGVGGSILNNNQVRVSIPCEECKIEHYSLIDRGINIEPSQWDGSDLFIMKEFPLLLIVTERFVHWLHQMEVENYQVIRTSDFSFSK